MDVQVPEVDAQVVCRQERLPVAAQADAVDVVRVRVAVDLAAPGRHDRLCAGDLQPRAHKVVSDLVLPPQVPADAWRHRQSRQAPDPAAEAMLPTNGQVAWAHMPTHGCWQP